MIEQAVEKMLSELEEENYVKGNIKKYIEKIKVYEEYEDEESKKLYDVINFKEREKILVSYYGLFYALTNLMLNSKLEENIDDLTELGIYLQKVGKKMEERGSKFKGVKHMKKFKINVPCDYIQGHLRYGHGEAIIEAESLEDAKEKAQVKVKNRDLELVCDDYEIDDCEYMIDGIEISEVQ